LNDLNAQVLIVERLDSPLLTSRESPDRSYNLRKKLIQIFWVKCLCERRSSLIAERGSLGGGMAEAAQLFVD